MVKTGRANENDEARLVDLLTWIPIIPTKEGKPRRVLTVMADGAYGVAWLITLVLAMGFWVKLKPRGKAGQKHGSHLGKKRYVVERTMAWFANDRRLRVCYERTWCSWQGFHELSACVFCAKRLAKVRANSS